MADLKFRIPSFASGINQSVVDGLLRPYEAVDSKNCDISNGSLKTFPIPNTLYTYGDNVQSLTTYYNKSGSGKLVVGRGANLYVDGAIVWTILNSKPLDSVNFEYEGERISVFTSSSDSTFGYNGTATFFIRNRRKTYNLDGSFKSYVDANGVDRGTNESNVPTLAPKGDFIELHYDRLWISGDSDNPDRLYFSTANVNGADIKDWTSPTEEGEANQHGGFIDVRSYDGSKIIGMKTIFNNLVIFKNKSAYKLFGSSPSNYQMVQLFSCNGAIADKSIANGYNGCFYLNSDGIYYYDGTNVNLISQKIKGVIASMNKSYASKSVGYYYNNKYYLAIPTGVSTVNNVLIEYNPETKAFSLFDVSEVDYFAENTDGKLIYASGNKIMTLFDGTSSLPLIWETPYVDFNSKDSRKLSQYIYFRGSGTGDIKFTLTTERGTKTLQVPLTTTQSMYRKKLKNKGRMMKLKIENVNSSSFELTAPEISIEADED